MRLHYARRHLLLAVTTGNPALLRKAGRTRSGSTPRIPVAPTRLFPDAIDGNRTSDAWTTALESDAFIYGDTAYYALGPDNASHTTGGDDSLDESYTGNSSFGYALDDGSVSGIREFADGDASNYTTHTDAILGRENRSQFKHMFELTPIFPCTC